jgi:uncharacterized membrane protein
LPRVLTLPEIHGLVVHLPILAVPVVFVLGFLRWRERGGEAVLRAEPWAFGAAVGGSALAFLSGLTVFGDARTTLRGHTVTLVYVHLALAFLLTAGLAVVGLLRWRREVSDAAVAVTGLLGVLLVVVIGYIGGRMVYIHAVGIDNGGELAQTATAATAVSVDLARHESPVAVGRWAFQTGFGCATCHGMQAQGGRGPGLSGGFEVARFEDTHGGALFPQRIVTPRMLDTLEAWLRTKPSGISRGGD